MSLRSMQAAWSAALTAPETHASMMPEPEWRGGLRTPAAGFAVYVNNVRITVHDALATTFPATARLLGPDAFRQRVLACLREAPPASGDLGDYGVVLIEQIAMASPGANGGIDSHVTAEVARYEWLLDQLPRCAREPAWSLTDALTLPPEDWPTLVLRPVGQARLFESDVPVRAWIARASDRDDLPTGPPERLLLVAGDYVAPRVLPLDAAQCVWYRNLSASHSLELATQAALEATPDFDLHTFLYPLLDAGALAVPARPTIEAGA